MTYYNELDRWIELLYKCEKLEEHQVKLLCYYGKLQLENTSNVPEIPSPVTVCGDIHGQFYDLLELFNIGGRVPNTNYLFMGDYVDRGFHSIETISLLVCLKVRFPHRMTILRGNHESKRISRTFGFYDEVIRKYGNPRVWNYFCDLFDFLPIAATIENKLFCVHGGLSPTIDRLDQMRALHRFKDVPESGPICDMLWSDPGRINGWKDSTRGAGYIFGEDITKTFLYNNNLLLITRGHKLTKQGYEWIHGKVVTIFSAPNYCYRYGNKGALMIVQNASQCGLYKFEKAPYQLGPST